MLHKSNFMASREAMSKLFNLPDGMMITSIQMDTNNGCFVFGVVSEFEPPEETSVKDLKEIGSIYWDARIKETTV